jgi:hypothetical protein
MYKRPAGDPTHEEACKWYRDYLASVRNHTLSFLKDRFGRFEQKRVEFVFSVPTVGDFYREPPSVTNVNKTWRDPRLVKQIEDQIKAAGFGCTPNERAHITLTEAEAAAVHALGYCMTEGQSFMVCDAGGGTTDVNALKVKSTGRMELEALSYTEGRAVGSTVIDFKVHQLVEGRLKHLEQFINGDLEAVVDRVMRNSFVSHKCNFGAQGYNVPKYMLPVPELPPGIDAPEAGIADSKIVITRYADQKEHVTLEQIR